MENVAKKENSTPTFAIILIVIGGLWLLRKIGVQFNFHFVPDILYSIKNVVHGLPEFVFSLPMVLIMVGLVLMAGKRSAGIVLIVIGSLFLLPKIFVLPGLTASIILPVVLIGIGVAMIAKRI